MVRLLVDDDGNRRSFHIGEGRLSLGSGPEAKLALHAPGVASLHADIEVHGGKATLHPKPGVSAPQMQGRPANGPVVLQHGVPVRIGGATLTVEYDEASSKSGVRERFDQPVQEGRRDALRSARPPTPAWVFVAVGVPVIAIVGWFAASRLFGTSTVARASAFASYQKALERYRSAQYEQAAAELASISADARLDEALAAKVAQLREDVGARLAETPAASDVDAKRYFDSQLEGFLARHMPGPITTPEARVFLKRARRFRERWPTSPDLAWVERQEARIGAALDLAQPPTVEDVAFEVQSLTWSHPRDYAAAFEAARAFRATAAGDDVPRIAQLLLELEAERAAWFEERLARARSHFERKEQGESIGVLLSIVRGAGDETMADDAAARLLEFGSVEELQTWLRGHQRNDPESFAKLEQNRVIAAFLREHGR
ncbi:MAG TPA: FHA domain-containing protein [Planctomycetota bacterium]|nr:FHA domain-containing protein [Planctomycetota bacterium]